MIVEIIPVPIFQDNYVWLIIDEKNASAIAVDPGDALPVKNFLAKNHLKLAGIFITHHHWDHTNGIQELKANLEILIYGPETENIVGVNNPVTEGEKIIFSQTNFNVLSTPGHTLGHISYYEKENGILFCGDTLFAAGCGRLFEGTAEQLYHSLQKIAALPDDTKIYCTHEYTLKNLHFAAMVEPSNKKIKARLQTVLALREKNQPTLPSLLKDEKATNPFLRCDSAEIISVVERRSGKTLQNPIQVFAELRAWKDVV